VVREAREAKVVKAERVARAAAKEEARVAARAEEKEAARVEVKVEREWARVAEKVVKTHRPALSLVGAIQSPVHPLFVQLHPRLVRHSSYLLV
jgi:hypothetical protein